jgi:hypothetical protein
MFGLDVSCHLPRGREAASKKSEICLFCHCGLALHPVFSLEQLMRIASLVASGSAVSLFLVIGRAKRDTKKLFTSQHEAFHVSNPDANVCLLYSDDT